MEDRTNDEGSSPEENSGIGKTAAKRREQLRQLEEKRRKTLARLNQARTELAQAVAEDEARARRRLRNQQLEEIKRLKFVLGDLVLNSMRQGGPETLSVTSEDLRRLADGDRQLLQRVWKVMAARAESNEPAAPGTPRSWPDTQQSSS